jgi:hypothetical protein
MKLESLHDLFMAAQRTVYDWKTDYGVGQTQFPIPGTEVEVGSTGNDPAETAVKVENNAT